MDQITLAWPLMKKEYDGIWEGVKFFSHFGAIPAHKGTKRKQIHMWGRSGQMYFDPGNEAYAHVIKKVWNPDWNLSNIERIGDVVERFLGLCFFMLHPDNPRACKYVLQACILQHVQNILSYTYDNWKSREALRWA